MNICILGAAGAGKSTAAKVIAHHIGARVIESDRLVHNAYAIGTEGWEALVQHYGEFILASDKSIDRKKLGQIIFQNPGEREFLKSVVDPFVRKQLHNEIVKQNETDTRVAHTILASYLMIEREWYPDSFHHAIVIASEPDQCIRRLVSARSWTAEHAKSVLQVQLSSSEIIKHARHLFGTRVSVIYNDKEIIQFRESILDTLDLLLGSSEVDAQKLWAQYLEGESSHLLSIFLAQEKRASWLLAISGAQLAVLLTRKGDSISGAFPVRS